MTGCLFDYEVSGEVNENGKIINSWFLFLIVTIGLFETQRYPSSYNGQVQPGGMGPLELDIILLEATRKPCTEANIAECK